MVVVVNSGGQDIRTMSESTRSVPRTANLRPRLQWYHAELNSQRQDINGHQLSQLDRSVYLMNRSKALSFWRIGA